MHSFKDADWSAIEGLRGQVGALSNAPTLLEAAAQFTELFVRSFDSVVLARVFAVLPLKLLPPAESKFARGKLPATLEANEAVEANDRTLVLSLLGTRGREARWNDRQASVDHLAVPLFNSASVEDAPMLARLLGDLRVDLKVLDDGRSVATRQMLGGRNGTFFVEDALTAIDERGRHVIPARDFVSAYGIRTVFGMGGAYLDGTLVVAIFFCSELLDRLVVDRFPSFISSFKMATAHLASDARWFSDAP